MPDQDADDTNALLQKVVSLLAFQIAGKMTVTEGAPLLDRLGLDPAEIARVLDSTPKAVNTRISEAKRK